MLKEITLVWNDGSDSSTNGITSNDGLVADENSGYIGDGIKRSMFHDTRLKPKISYPALSKGNCCQVED
jgi:hypothetical protein